MIGLSGVNDRDLLERELALATLNGWCEEVERSGAGRVGFVAGEAGVGKTSLVRRFCAGQSGSVALWGGCDPLATPAPLGPLVEVSGALGGGAAALVAAGARPYEVARGLLDDLAAQGGALVVLEDLHWADGGPLTSLHIWRGASSECGRS